MTTTTIRVQIDQTSDIGDWGSTEPAAVHEAHAQLVRERLAREYPSADIEVDVGLGAQCRVHGAADPDRVEDDVRAAIRESWDHLCAHEGDQRRLGVAA